MTARKTTAIACSMLALFPMAAGAWDRGQAVTFAKLPATAAHPEGIAVDWHGNFYVSDFAAPCSGPGPGHVVVFDPSGRLLRVLPVAGSSACLLGLDFHPTTHELLVIDFGGHKVLRVNPATGASAPFTVIGGTSGLNALTFDAHGNVYISDSLQGIIWQTGPAGGSATVWAQSEFLTTDGVPPFGANGLAFNKAKTLLYVANTGEDTVVRIDAGTKVAEVFVNSINGADGLVIDGRDNIWVAANQADEIVVIEPKKGRAIAKLGDFDGVGPDGAPRGLLFPASLVFHGEFVYVTNLSLDLREFSPTFNAVDSEWAKRVTTQTVAKIRRPSLPGHDDED